MAGIEQNLDLSGIHEQLRARAMQEVAAIGQDAIDVDVVLHPRVDPAFVGVDPGVPAAVPPVSVPGPGAPAPGAPAPGVPPPIPAAVPPAPLDPATSAWAALRQQGWLPTMQAFHRGKIDPMAFEGQEQDEALAFGRDASRSESHTVVRSIEDIRESGKLIATLANEIKRVGEGTPAAARAAEELGRMLRRVDRLAESAKKAADKLSPGAAEEAREILEAEEAHAKSGKAAPGGGRGMHLDAGDLHQLASNPVGFAQTFAARGIFSKLAAAVNAETLGGAWAAMGGGAGAGAAMVGGSAAALYGGFQVPEWAFRKLSEGAETDAHRMLEDYRTSNVAGRRFDLRGALYDGARRSYEFQDVNMDNVRRSINSMGVSWAGTSHEDSQGWFFKQLDSLSQRNKEFGLQDGALEQFLGQRIRSGSGDRSIGDLLESSNRIGGLIEEGNKTGVAANEKLAALASLNQLAQGRMGFVAPETEKFLWGAQAAFDQSGHAALRGSTGAQVLAGIANNSKPEFQAAVYSDLFYDKDGLEKAGAGAFGKDQWDHIKSFSKGDRGLQAFAVANDPAGRLAYAQAWLKKNASLDPVSKYAFLEAMGIPPGQMMIALDELEHGTSDFKGLADRLSKQGSRGATAAAEGGAKAGEVEGATVLAASFANLNNEISNVQGSLRALRSVADGLADQRGMGAQFRRKAWDSFEPAMTDATSGSAIGIWKALMRLDPIVGPVLLLRDRFSGNK